MPDHRAGAARLDELREVPDMPADQLAVRHAAAVRAAGRIRLVAPEVEERRVSEVLVQLHDEFAQDPLRFGVREAPVPTARLEQRFVLRLQVENRMLLRAAACGRCMPEGVELRHERDAQVAPERHEAPHLRLRHLSPRPPPPRMFLATVHPPRFQNGVVELQQGREADGALDLLRAHFGEPAEVDGPERQVGTVGN